MKTFKKITLLISAASFCLTTLTVNAQSNESPMGDAVMVVRKIEGSSVEAYSSTIDLNDKRKQLLMAGQNYQTNYAIYASFEINASSLGTDYITFKNVDFEIVNYKPTYFIGIDSIVVAPNKMKDGLAFEIYTRALSDKNEYSLNNSVLKNLHFQKGSYLHSKRILNPMFPEIDAAGKPVLMKDGRVACKSDDGRAFDFEFFYKDGRHVVRKEDYDKEEVSTQVYKDESVSMLPSKRCWTSYNKIMF